jgi:hypothetical protein
VATVWLFVYTPPLNVVFTYSNYLSIINLCVLCTSHSTLSQRGDPGGGPRDEASHSQHS